MSTQQLPVFSTTEQLLQIQIDRSDRIHQLASAFEQKFGNKPQLFGRSPGRVNLIGEHIDYEGYGVLPMAIQQDTLVAIAKAGNGSKIVVTNIECDKFVDVEFDIDPNQQVNTEDHQWTNYFLAAYKGVFDVLDEKESVELVGLNVMVHGVVPTGSGISSSSALVVASFLAVLGIYGKQSLLDKAKVAEATCVCERYVGTQSGGMDQAIGCMGEAGSALKIDFNPVRGEKVDLPGGVSFVIANSLTVSNKQETADKRYNLRVVECRLAAVVIAAKTGKGNASSIQTLKEVEPVEPSDDPIARLNSLCDLGVAHLHEEPYSQEEVEQILGIDSLTSLFSENKHFSRVLNAAKELGGFKLLSRAKHVCQEAARVLLFKQCCEDESLSDDDKCVKLGELMCSSQDSCRDLYECSSEELDALCSLAMSKGAYGSRLTGAGWGGCTVSLVPEQKVDEFIEALKEGYFINKIKEGVIKEEEEELSNCVFSSKPSAGAFIYTL